jgi:capsid portal protein
MQIMQRFYVTFGDGSKKGVIIHEYGDKFAMMISDDGWFRYFPENGKPKIYNTAKEAFDEISKLWKFSEAVSIKTTNEFIKVEELKVMFECEIEHV